MLVLVYTAVWLVPVYNTVVPTSLIQQLIFYWSRHVLLYHYCMSSLFSYDDFILLSFCRYVSTILNW